MDEPHADADVGVVADRGDRRPAVPGAPALGTAMLVGAVCGLAWAAAFRGWMASIAGGASAFGWAGTFLAVLLPGVVAGGLLGLAEAIRRRGGRPHWRWLALAPLAFAVAPLLLPGAIEALLTQALGGGAIAVPLAAIAGGFALSGRGSLWARIPLGVLAVAFAGALVATTAVVGGIRFSLDQPRGAWAATLAASAFAVLALAASIPFRRVVGVAAPGAGRG
ncbi:hypothetical protein GCM10009819_15260 [Agromyces tropicus]|uniref:Uncharacterized protein n=1 Tax=Agromyces tropicus TaxID=555371 RepID=A0ABN2U9Y2_9MICO